MRFAKYHALGNDYLVLEPKDCPALFSPLAIRKVCHRHYGLGSDGILYGPIERTDGTIGLRILNPDGSEAEKSGNGIRIFCRHLLETKRIKQGEEFRLHGKTFRYWAATVGNPHCVIPVTELTADLAKTYGPALEVHPNFPNRTNVQFMKVLDRANIQIEIWERGAGYTLASGSSSSACAAVARKMGSVDPDLTVNMPGGKIMIGIGGDYSIVMTGPTTPVGIFEMHPDVPDQDIAV